MNLESAQREADAVMAQAAAPWFGDGVDPWLAGLPVGLLAAMLLPPWRARTRT